LLLVAFLLVNAPNCRLFLVLASVVQGDAVNCNLIKIGGNFLFCLSSRAKLHFKDQVSPTCTEGDLRLCFH